MSWMEIVSTVEIQPEVLSDDDPMLAEGAGDLGFDCILVDVGSRAPEWILKRRQQRHNCFLHLLLLPLEYVSELLEGFLAWEGFVASVGQPEHQ